MSLSRLCFLIWYVHWFYAFQHFNHTISNGYKIHSQFGPRVWARWFFDVGKRSVSQMRSYYPKWIRERAKPIVRQASHHHLFFCFTLFKKTGLPKCPTPSLEDGTMISSMRKKLFSVQTSVSKWSLLDVSTKSGRGSLSRLAWVPRLLTPKSQCSQCSTRD